MNLDGVAFIVKTLSKKLGTLPFIISVNGYDFIKRKHDKKSIFLYYNCINERKKSISHDPCKAAVKVKVEILGKTNICQIVNDLHSNCCLESLIAQENSTIIN